MRRLGTAVAAGLLAAACGGSTAERPAVAEIPPDSAVARLYRAGLAMGTGHDSVIAALGEPVESSVEAQPNRHDPSATDTVRTLEYPAATWTFLEAGGTEFLVQVQTQASGGPLDVAPLRPGRTSRAAITGFLGAADRVETRADTTVLWYERPGSVAGDMVALHLTRDTLRQITWAPYVD